jgi:hypothetical protein
MKGGGAQGFSAKVIANGCDQLISLASRNI